MEPAQALAEGNEGEQQTRPPKNSGKEKFLLVYNQLLSNPPSWHEASRRATPAREPIFLETLCGMPTLVFTQSVNEGAKVEKR